MGQSTLEQGEKEQKEDLHPRQLSALAWPLKRKQDLEGYKGKGSREYLGITHTMGSGDGEQKLCWWDTAPWCLCHREEPRVPGLEGQCRPAAGPWGLGTEGCLRPLAPAPTTSNSEQEGGSLLLLLASQVSSGLGFLSQVIGTEGNGGFLFHQP